MHARGMVFDAANPAPERPFHALLRRIEAMPAAVNRGAPAAIAAPVTEYGTTAG